MATREEGVQAIVEWAVKRWLTRGDVPWSDEMLNGLTDDQLRRCVSRSMLGSGMLAEWGYRKYKNGIGQEPEAREFAGILVRDLAPYDTRCLSPEDAAKDPVTVVEDLSQAPHIPTCWDGLGTIGLVVNPEDFSDGKGWYSGMEEWKPLIVAPEGKP